MLCYITGHYIRLQMVIGYKYSTTRLQKYISILNLKHSEKCGESNLRQVNPCNFVQNTKYLSVKGSENSPFLVFSI